MRIVSVALLLAFLAPPARAQAPEDLPRHRLVYSLHSDAARTDYDVWTVCADGTQMASLVAEPGDQIQAAVSPDGATLAYVAVGDSARDVFTRPLGRGEAVNRTDHPADDTGPVWSPDGATLAFFSTRDAARPELYTLALDTGAVTRRTENDRHDGGRASWTPDGRAILFTRYFPGSDGAPGAGEVVRLDLASGEETVLTALGGYNGSPAVSPDGSAVLFHRSFREGAELWTMGADGQDPRPLTDTFVDEYSPAWSPDGRWVAYTAGTQSDNLGTFDLWIMRPDGSDRRLVVAGPNSENWPTWRPGDAYCR